MALSPSPEPSTHFLFCALGTGDMDLEVHGVGVSVKVVGGDSGRGCSSWVAESSRFGERKRGDWSRYVHIVFHESTS